MQMVRQPAGAAVLALALVAAVSGTRAGGEITVSAAASLTDVLQQVAAIYESRTGQSVALNFGASNTLARQIRSGARVDVFISADEAQMDLVAAHVVPNSRVDLLSNRLAIAVSDDRPHRFPSAHALTHPAIRRIAIGDPAAVPAGVYARAYLEKIGIWEAVAHKVVPSGSVRLALAAVENGAVDAAIVYRTDITTAQRAREALVIPAAEGPRIVYPAVALRGGNPTGAERFLDLLQDAEAARIFERAGFTPLVRRGKTK
jgi:molybdate transport system substrate-binding protein